MEKTFTYSRACLFVSFIFISLAVHSQLVLVNQYTIAGDGTTTMDSGLATKRPLVNPVNVAWTPTALYIVDSGGIVHKVDTQKIMTIFAGGGTGGAIENGPATEATLQSPNGIVVDRAGNVYISESLGHRVRKITPAGIITTVAGRGIAGYYGEGVPATRALLNQPSGLTMDKEGNLYIADRLNHRVRKLNMTDGTISTVAGTGDAGYSGDSVAATTTRLNQPYCLAMDSSDNLLIGELKGQRVRKVTPAGFITTITGQGWAGTKDYGPAVEAPTDDPRGLAVDSVGNIYLSNAANYEVDKIDTNGIISLYFEGLLPYHNGLQVPAGITVSHSGNPYVADERSGIVYQVEDNNYLHEVMFGNAGNGAYSYNGDGSIADQVALPSTLSLYLDRGNNLYFTDRFSVMTIQPNGQLLATVAGTAVSGYSGDGGRADTAQLNDPYGICRDPKNNLYIGTRGDNRIRMITPDSIIHTFAGNGLSGYFGDGGPATQASLAGINGLYADFRGNIYVSDSVYGVVRRIDTAGFIHTFAGTGTPGYAGDGGPAAQAQLARPNSISGDMLGNIYIADDFVNSVRKVDTNGVITTIIGGNPARGNSGDGGPPTAALFGWIRGIQSDDQGNIWIQDPSQGQIRRFIRDSGTIYHFGIWEADTVVYKQAAMAVSLTNTIYLSDTIHHQIILDSINTAPAAAAQTPDHAYDTVKAFIRAPANKDYYFGYYNTYISGPLFERMAALLPDFSYFSDSHNDPALPQGTFTFIAVKDTFFRSYNGASFLQRHYGITPPAGQDSLPDILEIYISYQDASDFDIAVPGHYPLFYSDFNGTGINAGGLQLVIFHGQGSTPEHPTGPVEVISPIGSGKAGPAFYSLDYPITHGYGNMYLTNMAVTVLPLTLLSFTGNLQGTDAHLEWKTSQEVNTKGFMVERSADSTAFASIGEVTAFSTPGDHTYNFVDKGLTPGAWYYRLKMEDIDGRYTYSHIIALTMGSTGSFRIYPNPAKDIVYVQLPDNVTGECSLQLTDRQGAILQTREISFTQGQHVLLFNVASLPAGSYFISVVSGSQHLISQFIK